MKILFSVALLCGFMFSLTQPLLANGGAWQTGVPSTGNAAPSDKKRTTAVAIEEENLTIDLHQEFASVEVGVRLLAILLFQFLTTPLSAYVIANAAYLRGLPPKLASRDLDEWGALGAADRDERPDRVETHGEA